LFINNGDPITIREALDSDHGKLWKRTMVEEMKALDNNEASDLV